MFDDGVPGRDDFKGCGGLLILSLLVSEVLDETSESSPLTLLGKLPLGTTKSGARLHTIFARSQGAQRVLPYGKLHRFYKKKRMNKKKKRKSNNYRAFKYFFIVKLFF